MKNRIPVKIKYIDNLLEDLKDVILYQYFMYGFKW